MTVENWKLQVSLKTPVGDLINIRANTADELSVLLEGIADYSVQIASTQKAVGAAYAVAPLVTGNSTPVTTPEQSFFQPQAQTPSATSAPGTTPTCVHGSRKFLSGISKKNGKPYSMWVCPQPQGTDQCQPVNG